MGTRFAACFIRVILIFDFCFRVQLLCTPVHKYGAADLAHTVVDKPGCINKLVFVHFFVRTCTQGLHGHFHFLGKVGHDLVS
uniref:Putative secreted protein n=1 Tax=Ixodes ricinus TaxID=34613 RepID=A0A6B0UDS3_IXORI